MDDFETQWIICLFDFIFMETRFLPDTSLSKRSETSVKKICQNVLDFILLI